ncbi:MAG: hypothetical protein KGI29_07860 [Pseudomonadota bacterium]|nr:hypothetical protein [Pseudomonadota bacterium]MDE3036984.1 hypothetical protein [Pseudomonadota bacterium]
MTDANAVSAPLKLTIHPLPQAAQGTFLSGAGNAPTFKDLLDTINPLEHIPIISSIYQSITGDTPSTGSRLAGGALFGGPLGFAASLFNAILKSGTGADLEGNVMAAIEGRPVPALQTSQATQVASDSPLNYMSANQRASYDAYVSSSRATQSGGTGSVTA